MNNTATLKGFVQWTDDDQTSFFWTDGKDVFQASVHSVADQATGYIPGRWVSTVEHWNRYTGALSRTTIKRETGK